MTARIINGTEISNSIRFEVARQVAELRSEGVVPGLAAVLVGDDPASVKYVESIKGRACTAAGIQPFIKQLPGATGEKELLRVIESLN
ncbi:MAG: tetrahydrofolate dehydrogenase/cyclohydrolase catalytic domain-containing protein, partial [Actinomycetota bacterium]